MIDRDHDLSVTWQARVLNISRSSVYYLPRPASPGDLAPTQYQQACAGPQGLFLSAAQVGGDPAQSGLGNRHHLHPMARGFVYLAAVVDWFSRRVLAWRVSISMAVGFCIEAVEEALGKYGAPEIFNSDQGSQFTSMAFTCLLRDNGIAISMDGRGSWRDNVFVERLCLAVHQVRGGLPARL